MNCKRLLHDFSTSFDYEKLCQDFLSLSEEDGKKIAKELFATRFQDNCDETKSITNKALGGAAVATGAGVGGAAAVASGIGVTKVGLLGATLAFGSTPVGWIAGGAALAGLAGYGAYRFGKKMISKQEKNALRQKKSIDGYGHALERILNPYVFYYVGEFQEYIKTNKDAIRDILSSDVKLSDITEENIEEVKNFYNQEELPKADEEYIEVVCDPLFESIDDEEKGIPYEYLTYAFYLFDEAMGFFPNQE